jgi:flagellar hook-length control protein FliK
MTPTPLVNGAQPPAHAGPHKAGPAGRAGADAPSFAELLMSADAAPPDGGAQAGGGRPDPAGAEGVASAAAAGAPDSAAMLPASMSAVRDVRSAARTPDVPADDVEAGTAARAARRTAAGAPPTGAGTPRAPTAAAARREARPGAPATDTGALDAPTRGLPSAGTVTLAAGLDRGDAGPGNVRRAGTELPSDPRESLAVFFTAPPATAPAAAADGGAAAAAATGLRASSDLRTDAPTGAGHGAGLPDARFAAAAADPDGRAAPGTTPGADPAPTGADASTSGAPLASMSRQGGAAIDAATVAAADAAVAGAAPPSTDSAPGAPDRTRHDGAQRPFLDRADPEMLETLVATGAVPDRAAPSAGTRPTAARAQAAAAPPHGLPGRGAAGVSPDVSGAASPRAEASAVPGGADRAGTTAAERADAPRPAATGPVPLALAGVPPTAVAAADASNGSEAAAPAASYPVTVPLDDPRFGEAFAERVTWMVREGLRGAELTLHPQELGPIRIELALDGDAATLGVVAAHAEARGAIEQALPRLREMLAGQGLQLGGASVDAGAGRRADDGGSGRGTRGEPRAGGLAAAIAVGGPQASPRAARAARAGGVDVFA